MDLEKANALIQQYEAAFSHGVGIPPGETLYTGVDLGTSYIVLSVVDGSGKPVGGAKCFAKVVKDGLVVDYIGAVEIVKSLKNELEGRLGCPLIKAGVAYPPGISREEQMVFVHIAEAAGFEVEKRVDEPTAANQVLDIKRGAIVDIGGGTTGLAVLEKGKVIYTADEPTGGEHFSLVLAGAFKIPFMEAEKLKTRPAKQRELLPLVKPVMQKVATIIKNHLKTFKVDVLYLVGGSSCFAGIEDVIAKELEVKVLKPKNPLLVTPLGIALSVKGKGD